MHEDAQGCMRMYKDVQGCTRMQFSRCPFPNGITDHLILNQHNDECNYLGHLEKDQDVCVAMTGCLGQDHVEFTILSKAFENPHFLWHKDGSVEQLRTVNEVCNMSFEFFVCAP